MLNEALKKVQQKILEVYGSKAQPWLERVPTIIAQYEQKWGIKVLEPVPDLSYNLVYFAERLADKTKVILKGGFPNPDQVNEIHALQYFAGHGCVELLNYDFKDGVMLLEQALPGSMLSTLTLQDLDEQTVYVFADIVNMLHVHPAIITAELRKIPKLHDRAAEYREVRSTILAAPHNYAGFDLEIFDHAAALFAKLNSSTKETVVLHGDLHHFNILSAQRNPWLAIDPKGLIGDPVFELAAFMCNPYPQVAHMPNLAKLLLRRIELLHTLLGFDKQRIRDWSVAHTILAAGQNLITHGADWQEMFQIGTTLMALNLE